MIFSILLPKFGGRKSCADMAWSDPPRLMERIAESQHSSRPGRFDSPARYHHPTPGSQLHRPATALWSMNPYKCTLHHTNMAQFPRNLLVATCRSSFSCLEDRSSLTLDSLLVTGIVGGYDAEVIRVTINSSREKRKCRHQNDTTLKFFFTGRNLQGIEPIIGGSCLSISAYRSESHDLTCSGLEY